MLTRFAYLEKDRALANSGERTVDINLRDPITQIWLEIRCANGNNNNWHNPMHTNISSIEIIDGAQVIASVDGQQLLALVCADLGHMPHQRLSALGGDDQTLALPILFGRFIGDTEFSFDPKRFTNPQLRVKWNLATTNAVGVSGFEDADGTITAIAEVMEGAPKPRALLMRKEVYTWTSAVGTEYVDLPTDYPYRGIFYCSKLAAYHPWGIVSNLKITCDGGKFIPLDLAVEDLQYLLWARQPRLNYRAAEHMKHGTTFYSILEEIEDVSLNIEAVGDFNVGYTNWEYGSKTINLYLAGAQQVQYTNIGAHVHGYCPFGYYYIPFGDQGNPAEWFPAPSFDSVRLEATGVTASGVCKIGVVQEFPY